MSELVGQVIENRYVVEHVLGRGAMGVVYRAHHIRDNCEVAIKVMHVHLMTDPEMVRRFDREVELAGRLAHENVAAVIDTGDTADGRRYMVMELARGKTLTDALGGARLPHVRVIDVLGQLLAGLAHAHACGLVHRDLKPDNVLVDDDWNVRIVDFGIAVGSGDSDKRLTEAGLVLGTPHYMSPEQAQGLPADPRTDLFALGIIAYEMLAGVLPFAGNNLDVVLATVARDVPVMSARAPGAVVDRDLEAFVYRLLERDPARRFDTAEIALDALRHVGDPGFDADEITIPFHRAA